MSELKPCPFCGEGEDTNCLHITSNGTEGYFVECIFCGGGGPSSDGEGDAIEQWNTRQSPWISVDDRLPEANTDVFVMVKKRGARIAYQDQDGWFDAYDHGNYGLHGDRDRGWGGVTTHWMPIPPTQEKGDE